MIEIKCGEGKIILGDPCPPIPSFFFPIDPNQKPKVIDQPMDQSNKKEGEKNDSAQPS